MRGLEFESRTETHHTYKRGGGVIRLRQGFFCLRVIAPRIPKKKKYNIFNGRHFENLLNILSKQTTFLGRTRYLSNSIGWRIIT
ncbi:MAG: hypothetical protein D6698_06065, partial [Gammaproteobacteria bacterium]